MKLADPRLIAAPLAVAALSLAACGGSGQETTVEETVDVPVTTEETAPQTTTQTTDTTKTTTTTPKPQPVTYRRTCNISGVPNVKNPSVSVAVNAVNVPPSQANLGSCANVSGVVKGFASDGAEQPETVQGFRCVPTVYKQVKARVNCERSAGNGRVVLTFQMSYAN